MAPMFHAVVTDDLFTTYEQEQQVLNEVGCDLSVLDVPTRPQDAEQLENAHALLVNNFVVSREVIETLRSCRIISRYGVGYDGVDVPAATRAGIWVSRVPDYCREEVSDHALALLLSCIRCIPFVDRRVRDGEWKVHHDYGISRISGCTLGLVGFGAIARSLLRKVSAWNLSAVLVYDPFVSSGAIAGAGALPVGLDVLLSRADFISVHAPLSEETKGMLGRKELARMKPGAIVVNTSRGGVIDETALAEALDAHHVRCAGLDVFADEPLAQSSPLRRCANVVLTDHMGYFSQESIAELKTQAARNIAEVLKGNRPISPVNEL